MRICHITSVHQWDDVRIFKKQCTSLAQAGYEVHLVCANQVNGLYDGVQVHSIEQAFGNRFDRMLALPSKLKQKALELDADIYQIHDSELLPMAYQMARKGHKVVYDSHEDLPKLLLIKEYLPDWLKRPVARVIQSVEHFVVNRIAGVISATEDINSNFEASRCPNVAIKNYPLNAELKIDAPYPKTQHRVAYVGSISEVRGVQQMIEAVHRIEGLRMDLGGVFTDEAFYKHLQTLPGWASVDFHGKLDRPQIKAIFKEAKLGLVTLWPTANHITSLPVKMFEYMAASLPVIASTFPLWQSIIETNNCGICVDPKSVDEVEAAIRQVLDDPAAAQAMGEAGRRAIEKEYSWESEAPKLIEFYKQIAHA